MTTISMPNEDNVVVEGPWVIARRDIDERWEYLRSINQGQSLLNRFRSVTSIDVAAQYPDPLSASRALTLALKTGLAPDWGIVLMEDVLA